MLCFEKVAEWNRISDRCEIVFLNEKLNRTLMENHRILKYNVDGYDSETKTVYKFYGCFFHGCPRCYAKDAYNPLAKKLMSELYDYTITREWE